jgi:Family of unknown function (DUF6186)
MSSHDITVAGYLLIAWSGVGLEVYARRTRSRVPTIGRVLSHLMRTRSGRVGVVAAWAWLGMHYFAR